MPTEDELRHQRQDIVEEYFRSDTHKLFSRIKVHDIGSRIFLMNFEDWQRVIEARMPKDPIEWIKLNEDHSWVEPFIVDVTRVLHNFVASALTLVDTTRVLYRELYEPKKLMPTYQQEIDKRFIKDGVANFVKDLRQFCQHYRLPLVTARLSFQAGPTSGELGLKVPLSFKEINLWSGWSSTSKAFISTFKDAGEIDLEAVLEQYRDKIVDFNNWFLEHQKLVHADAVAHRAEFEKKIAEINAQIESLKS